jgi:ABC-type uncharacterized transport system permease subunit
MIYDGALVITCCIVGSLNYEPLVFLALFAGMCALFINFIYPIAVHMHCIYKIECKDTVTPG